MNRILTASIFGAALLASPLAFAPAYAMEKPAPKPPVAASAEPTAFPVCDAIHMNHCIELGRHRFIDRLADRAYPQCAHLSDVHKRASCIDAAFNSTHDVT